jgi:ABC-type dipeptide/oligopeptide/nickel transport system ATPase component
MDNEEFLTLTPETLGIFIRSVQQNDRDFTIALTGFKGCGKSTFAMSVAKCAEGENFSIEKNIVLTPDGKEIADHIEKCSSKPVIVLDEAIGSLYREKWSEAAQKALHIYLQQFQRKEKQCVLLMCIPSIHDLRRPLIRASVNMWIHLYETRGFGVVMMRSALPVQDCFFLDNFEKFAQHSKVNIIQQYEVSFQNKTYSRMPTFLGFIRFDNVDEKLYQDYKDYVALNRAKIMDKIFGDSEGEKLNNEYSLMKKKLKMRKMKEELENEGKPKVKFCVV